MKKSGWFRESFRHSLAAKGIKTRRYPAVKTAFGRGVQRFFKESEARRHRLAASAMPYAKAQSVVTRLQAGEVSLEGLTPEEQQKALKSGLRPREEAQKEILLKSLGRDLSAKSSNMMLFGLYRPELGNVKIEELESAIRNWDERIAETTEDLGRPEVQQSKLAVNELKRELQSLETAKKNDQKLIKHIKSLNRKIAIGAPLEQKDMQLGGNIVRQFKEEGLNISSDIITKTGVSGEDRMLRDERLKELVAVNDVETE